MSDLEAFCWANVERLPHPNRTVVTEELGRIRAMLRDACPSGAQLSFDFDGRLYVHVDVRTIEDLTLVESALPAIGAEIFHTVRRGRTSHHPFFHRVSAQVEA